MPQAISDVFKNPKNVEMEGLVFNILEKGDEDYADFYSCIGDDGISAKFVNEKLLACGDCIVAASVSGTVAAAVFIARTRHPIKGISAELVFKEGQAYIAYVYVKKAFRSRSLGKTIVARAVQYCIEQGYHDCIMAIYPDNQLSLKIARKYGFEKFCVLSVAERFFVKKYQCDRENNKSLGVSVVSEGEIALKF